MAKASKKAEKDRGSASDTLAGFRFQLLNSLAAWLDLKGQQQLWLERSEDYSVVGDKLQTDVQAKHSQPSTNPSGHSLQSHDVRSSLSRFWERSTRRDGIKNRLVFLSNRGVSSERDFPFPDDLPGLEYWKRAAAGGDVAPLRRALRELFADQPLGKWLATDPPDDEVRNRLLRRVIFAVSEAPLGELKELLLDRASDLLLSKSLASLASDMVVRSLTDFLFEVASDPNSDARRVGRRTLHDELEKIAVALRASNPLLPQVTLPMPSPQSVLVGETENPTTEFSGRTETLKSVLASSRGRSLIWLHGSHGLGKSILARLIADELGGRWISIDLRGVKKDDRLGTLVAWRDFMRLAEIGDLPAGFVIDDIEPDQAARLIGRLEALLQTVSARGAQIVVTSNVTPDPAMMLALDAARVSVQLAPYMTQNEVLDLVTKKPAPDASVAPAWTALIHASTSGHPQLVASKVVGLRLRNWPAEAMTEDFGMGASESVQMTREGARRKLLQDLTALGPKASDASRLYQRIGCAFDRVDERLARKLASADPSIASAGEILAFLKGPWLEVLPGGDLRLSPLLADAVNDVAPGEVTKLRMIAAEHWFGDGVMNERTLPLSFWNAYFSEHFWILFKLCHLVASLGDDKITSAAAQLAPIVLLHIDKPIFDGNAPLSAQLRLLQFEVANAARDGERASSIAAKLLIELEAVEHAKMRAVMTNLAAQKVLQASNVDVPATVLLEYAVRMKATRSVVEEMERSAEDSDEDDLGFDVAGDTSTNGGPNTDVTAAMTFEGKEIDHVWVLLSLVVNRLQSSARTLEFFRALNELASETRTEFLDGIKTVLKDDVSLVHGGWAKEQLSGNLPGALPAYESIKEIVTSWHRNDLTVEVIVAISVIYDEGLNYFEKALAEVDVGIALYGASPHLIRQKMKVLASQGKLDEAADLLVSIEDSLEESTPFSTALAYREVGLTAARAKRADDALRLLGRAIEAVNNDPAHVTLSAGLMSEVALVLWEKGERALGLLKLADVFETLEGIDPLGSRQSERVHQAARAIGGLFMYETGNLLRERPPVAVGQASELYSDDAKLQGVPLPALADNWRLLALVEASLDLNVGLDARSLQKQKEQGVIDIESLILERRYESLIRRGDLEGAVRAGVHAASARLYCSEHPGPIHRMDVKQLGEMPVEQIWTRNAEALLRIPLDILVWQQYCSGPEEIVDRLQQLAVDLLGEKEKVETLFKAASGIYAVGDGSPFALQVAAVLPLAGERLMEDPKVRLRHDFLLTGHVLLSAARHLLAGALPLSMKLGWQYVIDKQVSSLLAPSRNVPLIKKAIEEVDTGSLRGAAQIVLAAASAVGIELPSNWEEAFERIR
jgi:tetratricopeptide (TPR) repeat protein